MWLPYILAFVGGGLAEALVAFAAHHLHAPKPQVIQLDEDQLARIAELAKPDVSLGAQRALADMPNWQRPDIKLMKEILDARTPEWHADMERMADARAARHGKRLNPEVMEAGRAR